MSEPLAFEIRLGCPQAEAVDRVVDALKEQAFGVLTRIDLHEAFKEKLSIDFRPYTILGACNPPLAHRALSSVPEVGLLLPCNVTVEAVDETSSVVRIVNPQEMMNVGSFGEDQRIVEVGREASEKLQRVADALAR